MVSEPIPIRGGVIEEINTLEREIADHEEDADGARWRQAELVALALNDGETTRSLAAQWVNRRTGMPYGETHVRYAAAAWRKFAHLGARPPFNEAYHSDEVRRAAKKDEDAETKVAREEWKTAASDVIRLLAKTGAPFTSEEVTQHVGLPSGGSGMNLNNQVGALMRAAVKRGDIVPTGLTALSQNPTSHGAELQVWQGPTEAIEAEGTSDPQAWAFIRAIESLGKVSLNVAELDEAIHEHQRYRVEENIERAYALVAELRVLWRAS